MTHKDSAHTSLLCFWSHSEDPDMRFLRRQCCRILLVDHAFVRLECHRTKYATKFRCDVDGRDSVPTGDVCNTNSKRESPLIVE